ncbi:MAG: macro domain-containing protein [Patescibacteria group bacterium]|nr:macro domain-containing protein [Patescibacteria group bacterium]MDE2015478.1 macro domain-containing protein [Patescibacteria group bacterium]MDE2226906.1 macro domain-containing protein [Patescibacteria group bacterium]
MTKIEVVSGDIARVESDALITAINSGGMWFGGIDGVIQRAAGELFHQQAANAKLVDGEAIVARGGNRNSGKFKNVIFVVDDLTRPLHQIVLAGLRTAETSGFSSVSLPTIRMGVMLGVVEKTPQQAVSEMVHGVNIFLSENPKSVQNITVVVYNETNLHRLLASAFSAN